MTFPADVPRPAPQSAAAPFWEFLRNGELRLQRCAGCGVFRHPPGPRCAHCRSDAVEWVHSAGTGEVWSYTVCHPPVLPAFAAHTPYLAAVVRLDEGVCMVTNLPHDPAATVTVGARVVLAPVRIDADLVLPTFRLADPAA